MERGQGKGMDFTFSPLSTFINFILHIYLTTNVKLFRIYMTWASLNLLKVEKENNKLEPDEMHRENSGLKIRYKS